MRCLTCKRVIRGDVEPLYHVPSEEGDSVPMGCHPGRCLREYNSSDEVDPEPRPAPKPRGRPRAMDLFDEMPMGR